MGMSYHVYAGLLVVTKGDGRVSDHYEEVGEGLFEVTDGNEDHLVWIPCRGKFGYSVGEEDEDGCRLIELKNSDREIFKKVFLKELSSLKKRYRSVQIKMAITTYWG